MKKYIVVFNCGDSRTFYQGGVYYFRCKTSTGFSYMHINSLYDLIDYLNVSGLMHYVVQIIDGKIIHCHI